MAERQTRNKQLSCKISARENACADFGAVHQLTSRHPQRAPEGGFPFTIFVPQDLWQRILSTIIYGVFKLRLPVNPLLGFVISDINSPVARMFAFFWFVDFIAPDTLSVCEIRAKVHPNLIRQVLKILKQVVKKMPSDVSFQVHYLGETEHFTLSYKELKQKIEVLEAALKKMQDEFIEAENEILDFDETQKQRNEFLKFTQQRRIDKRKPKLKVWSDISVPRASRAPDFAPPEATGWRV